MKRILVIKLGALGDFILAYRAMAAIRAHHRNDHLTLLTISSMRALAEGYGLFDEIWSDGRPQARDIGNWIALVRRLNRARFDRVYDLQTQGRTALYFRLMGPPFGRRPQWSGIAAGCSHPHDNPDRDDMHTLDRMAEQLSMAGVAADGRPLDLSWAADVSRHRLAEGGQPYVLMVPGGSARHPEKRWPAECYAELARRLAADGYRPVVIGTRSEAEACSVVTTAVPGALDLCEDSPIPDVLALAQDAAGAVGNDTGPMHVIAATGCPSLALFSGATYPGRNRPRGPYEGPGAAAPPAGTDPVTVAVLQREPLATLTVDEVRASLLLR